MEIFLQVQEHFDNFKDTRAVDGTKDFLESNSLVAKAAFLLLILIVFVLGIRIAVQFLSWLFQYNTSPYLIDGMVDGKTMQVIPQDPSPR